MILHSDVVEEQRAQGNRVSAGTYFYKLVAPGTVITRKLVIVR